MFFLFFVYLASAFPMNECKTEDVLETCTSTMFVTLTTSVTSTIYATQTASSTVMTDIPTDRTVSVDSDFNSVESRYPLSGGCEVGGVFSVNEYGASICEYPASACRITKYFVYSGGGNGVELCCGSQSDCNYDSVKNYCLPGELRCVDGSFFGCSVKGGSIFDSCETVG